MRFILVKSVIKVSNELNSLIICPMAQNVLSMNCPGTPCNMQFPDYMMELISCGCYTA